MRFAVVLVCVLGVGFAREFSASGSGTLDFEGAHLTPDQVKEAWEMATTLFGKQVMEDFKNGTGSSRPRRSARTTEFSRKYDELSNIYQIYEDIVVTKHNITKRQAAGSGSPAQCPNSFINCGNAGTSKYRNFDGTCNNLQNPRWGAKDNAQNRVLPNKYDDGFNSPRGGFNNRLPNARVVSVNVHPDNTNAIHRVITNMVPQFGQFLDHDMTLTPNSNAQCCQSNSDSNCWSIFVSQNDPFYSRFGKQCMDFTRSTPCIKNGIREQMNANTAYIDASQIYGSDLQRAQNLRTFQGGMLKSNPSFRGFLPNKNAVSGTSSLQGDFVAGDDRINEMPDLAVMHTVWLREHNRIAQEFQRISPGWNDERIYQETRRIVIAEFQNVVFKEYLPIVLGPDAYSEYNLDVSTWSDCYSSSVDASIFNAFSTAAYRFGHSLVAGKIDMYNAQDQVVDSFQIANEYFQSKQVTRNNGEGFDMLLRGLFRQNAPDFDRYITDGVTNNLFRQQGAQFGDDLAARNIQRGRDHGVAGYAEYRKLCGGSDLTTLTSFPSNPPPGITADGWSIVSKLYARPSDIDLFVGGLIEIPVNGGLSGNTFTCLKGAQFQRLKCGDRYFFTNSLATGFNGAQLDNLVARRFSDIVCDNSMQPSTPANVFFVENSATNPSTICGATSGRPKLNLNLFI